MKPLLIGEMPSRSGDRYWMFPLSGAVAQALCQMADIPPQSDGSRYGKWTWALYEHFDCINAIERFQKWNERHAANRLRAEIEPDREVVILLGRLAQDAYVRMQHPATSMLDRLDFFKWVADPNSPTGRRQVIVLPHPSSLNRVYHEDRDRRRAGCALRRAIEDAARMYETRL